MVSSNNNISFVFSLFAAFSLLAAAARGGEWVLLQRSVGISAMHMQFMHNNKVVIFDRTNFGVSNLSLPAGKPCLQFEKSSPDCSTHSLLYDVVSNTFHPLTLQSNVWCSSGALDANGTLVQTGGSDKGNHRIHLFAPSAAKDDASDWDELPYGLAIRRWYSSNHLLPDGRIIVLGGQNEPCKSSYEFFPRTPSAPDHFNLLFLNETSDPWEDNNLYPFLYLLPDGNPFVFANRKSISLDYINNHVVREFPVIPGEKRRYPSSGSSVLLPLKGLVPVVEVMVCGGATNGSYPLANRNSNKVFVEASKTCGRLRVTDADPQWVMEEIPMSRVMGDMILLPSGDVLIINGASNGTAGWENAVGPVLNPILYRPTESDLSKRFAVMNASSIPRIYHSTAILLPDGRILVGGSKYQFNTVPYHTELSLEAFLPPYMAPQYPDLRPTIVNVGARGTIVTYCRKFSVTFKVANYRPDQETAIAMIAPSFNTHSFSMNQRMIYLDFMGGVRQVPLGYKLKVIAPATKDIAPPGYYMMFVVHGGIPGESVWMKIVH